MEGAIISMSSSTLSHPLNKLYCRRKNPACYTNVASGHVPRSYVHSIPKRLPAPSPAIQKIWRFELDLQIDLCLQVVKTSRLKDSPTSWLRYLPLKSYSYFPSEINRDNLLFLFDEWLSDLQVAQEAVSNSRLHGVIQRQQASPSLGSNLYNFP